MDDSIFGLDIPLMRLVNVLKAQPTGMARRSVLSYFMVQQEVRVARLFKKGLQRYSQNLRVPFHEWVCRRMLHITGGGRYSHVL